MNIRIKKYGLISLIFVVCGLLNYNPQLLFGLKSGHWGWIFSATATILIILLMMLRDPNEWKQKLGIHFNRFDIAGLLLTTTGLLILSYFLVDFLSMQNGYTFKPQIIYYKEYFDPKFPFHLVLAGYIYFIPETLNEEMLIGAVLLMGLERNFKKIDKNVIAIFVALIFCLIHQAFYKWNPLQPGISLTLMTIICLFFIGVIRNFLIIKTRKIAYSWAIHLSFNLVFLSGFFINISNNSFACEPEKFNIVFGNSKMVIITGLLALFSLIWSNEVLRNRQLINGILPKRWL
jgi:Type II CAAX prenyl endopeptidase Rce1-like